MKVWSINKGRSVGLSLLFKSFPNMLNKKIPNNIKRGATARISDCDCEFCITDKERELVEKMLYKQTKPR